MLETNRTNANNFVVSQTVTELIANSILNEGLTLLKVESGCIDNDTQIYYFSNNIGHMLPTDEFPDTEFAVKLVFLRRESVKVDERLSERNLFIYDIDKFTVSQAYTDNNVAATGFLDSLYEQLNHETVAEYYIYDETLFTSLNDLIDFHLANKR